MLIRQGKASLKLSLNGFPWVSRKDFHDALLSAGVLGVNGGGSFPLPPTASRKGCTCVCLCGAWRGDELTAKPPNLYKLKTWPLGIPTSRHIWKTMPKEFCDTQDGPRKKVTMSLSLAPLWVCICVMKGLNGKYHSQFLHSPIYRYEICQDPDGRDIQGGKKVGNTSWVQLGAVCSANITSFI